MFCAPFFVEATCYDWCRWLLYKKGCWQVWLLSCNSCVNWRLWKLCRHYQHHVFSFTVHCFLIAMGINLYLEMVNNIAWNYLRMLISRKWYLLFLYMPPIWLNRRTIDTHYKFLFAHAHFFFLQDPLNMWCKIKIWQMKIFDHEKLLSFKPEI